MRPDRTFIALATLLLMTACGPGEREQQQQQQYEADLMQQMIQTDEHFNAELERVFERYFDLKNALVETDAGQAAAASEALVSIVREVQSGTLNEETVLVWSALADRIIAGADRMSRLDEADEQRIHFEEVSDAMISLVETFRPLGYEVYVQSCPMVRDGSADWLSREEQIRNPYHGDRMMNCGEVLRRI